MADTFSEATKIIVDLLGIDAKNVTSNSRFQEDLEADSLDLVELLMAFEDKFGAEISDEDAQKITTVGEAVRYIDRHNGQIPEKLTSRVNMLPKQKTTIGVQDIWKSVPESKNVIDIQDERKFLQKNPTSETVFISYGRSSWDAYVVPLIKKLHNNGVSVWVDQYLIEGGQNWQDEINRALETCDRMILCVTKKSLESQYVKMEYRYFFNHKKLLIPLLCEQTDLHPELEGIQYTLYKDFDKLLMRLRL